MCCLQDFLFLSGMRKDTNILVDWIKFIHLYSWALGFTEQEEVTGLFSKDCVLPCLFPPGHDEVIHWRKGIKNVHSYYEQEDQLQEQDPHYRQRTHLFQESISSGNASLKLSNLTMTDEGSYTCYVGTVHTRTEVEDKILIFFSPTAPSSYALEYQKTNTERKLKCYAFLTYPAPNISWVQGNVSIQETDREETRSGVLYSLRSDQDIVSMADTYSCHIHLHGEVWAAEWKMQGRNEWKYVPASLLNVIAGISQTKNSLSAVGNAVTSVLASFSGTSRSHQPRVRVNESDFSLILDDLTADDSGEYLCNVSTPFYTKLSVRTLHISKLPLLQFQRINVQSGQCTAKRLNQKFIKY
uniref:HERV-H LTR-associating 2 n=1 Tax=Malurus cyaneus samueli TaxID=2593467 RepID=A0A8C5X5G8_9PASS